MTAMSAPTKVEVAELGQKPAEASATGHATRSRLLRLRWGLAACGILLLIVASAVFAPQISPHDPLAVNIRHRLAPPAWVCWR